VAAQHECHTSVVGVIAGFARFAILLCVFPRFGRQHSSPFRQAYSPYVSGSRVTEALSLSQSLTLTPVRYRYVYTLISLCLPILELQVTEQQAHYWRANLLGGAAESAALYLRVPAFLLGGDTPLHGAAILTKA
jgi:hypothetical protein